MKITTKKKRERHGDVLVLTCAVRSHANCVFSWKKNKTELTFSVLEVSVSIKERKGNKS